MAYPTLHEITMAADDYWQAWQRLLSQASGLRQAIGQHTPDALGWKVEGDLAPLEAASRVYELGDSVYAGPVDGERSILTVRKTQAIALDSLQHIKILQRRPSRPEDKLGPDSLDFELPHGLPKLADLERELKKTGVACEQQRNVAHQWISLRYDNHEFKLGDRSVWSVCVDEAQALLV